MNDEIKSPDTTIMDENFNEDFDFGESETETRPIKTTTTKGNHRKILGLIFIVVIAILLIMGYRIIYSTKQSSTNHTVINGKPATESAKPTQPVAVTNGNSLIKTAEEIQQGSAEFAAALSGTALKEPPAPTTSSGTPNAPKATVATPTPLPTVQPAPMAVITSPETTKTTKTEKPVPLETETVITTEHTPTEAEVTKLQDGLNKLNMEIDSILSQIKYLDAYSREVSENLNKLNESISTMDNRLMTLTNTTSTLSKDVGNVKNEVGYVREVLKEDGLDINTDFSAKPKSGRAEKEGKIAIVEPEYTVHAVVPGRAWLKSSKGQIVTVTEGDAIGNYGKILVIDAANGVVLTSSGVAFR